MTLDTLPATVVVSPATVVVSSSAIGVVVSIARVVVSSEAGVVVPSATVVVSAATIVVAAVVVSADAVVTFPSLPQIVPSSNTNWPSLISYIIYLICTPPRRIGESFFATSTYTPDVREDTQLVNYNKI